MHLKLDALDLEGMAMIDNGLVNQMFRYHALRLGRDCADRPGESGARTLTITITAKPVANQQGGLETVRTEIDIKSKLPVHRTRVYEMRADEKNGLLFNPNFSDSVNQMPLPMSMDLHGDEGADD